MCVKMEESKQVYVYKYFYKDREEQGLPSGKVLESFLVFKPQFL